MQKLVILLLFGSSIYFFCLAYQEHQPFAEAERKMESIKGAVVLEDASEDPLDRKIDFQMLQSVNPDIIGWLYVPQIGVDAPVLKGNHDSVYLYTDFEGNYSPLGSVFTWAHADEKMTDPHLCLFAHNMMSGQMFGRLKEFQDADFVEKNPVFYLYTPERSKEWKIFSVFECEMTDAVFQDDWQGAESQTITLAACTGYGTTPYRLAVNAMVVCEKLIL